MTSPRKINANRINARFSTGPRTRAGKAAVASNAFRHGLSLPLFIDEPLETEIEKLVGHIVGPAATPEQHELARSVAIAQFELVRVRRARKDLLVRYLTKEGYRSPTEARKIISDVQLALRAIKKGRNPPPGLLEVVPHQKA